MVPSRKRGGAKLSSGVIRPAEQPGASRTTLLTADHFLNRLRCPGPLITPRAAIRSLLERAVLADGWLSRGLSLPADMPHVRAVLAC